MGWKGRVAPMSSLEIAAITFLCIFGGALLGMFCRSVLPEHHLNPESKDVVKVGMGLIATMAVVVAAGTRCVG